MARRFRMKAFVEGLDVPVFRLIQAGVLGLALGACLQAHEGHDALPTKGVEIDLEHGLITLSDEARRSLDLHTSDVEQHPLRQTVLAYATLVTPWDRHSMVSAATEGRIAKLHIASGDHVVAGQVMAEVASPQLDDLVQELRLAVEQRTFAKKQLDRLRQLGEDQSIAERDLLEAETRYSQLQLAENIASGKLRSLGIRQARIDSALQSDESRGPVLLPLISPSDGVVNFSGIGVGTSVKSDDPIFEVSDLSSLWVKIGVLERDVHRVKAGQPVELVLTAIPNEILQLTVQVPPVALNETDHLGTAWAELRNPSDEIKYLPGMQGSARIQVSAQAELPRVPAAAVLGSGTERYVLVEQSSTSEGAEFRRVDVAVMATAGEYAWLGGDGVFTGDRVVDVGGQVLSSFFVLGSLRISDQGIRNAGLRMEKASERPLDNVTLFEGVIDLAADAVSRPSSPLKGVLSKILVERGENVTEGQTLAELKSLELQDLQFTLLQSGAESKLWAEAVRRLRSAGNVAVVGARRLLELEIARDQATSRRDSARHKLLTLGMTDAEIEAVMRSGIPLEALPLRAPIAGVVASLNKVLGEGVAAGDALFEIQNTSKPFAKSFVSEQRAIHAALGSQVRVRTLANPGLVMDGEIRRSEKRFDGRDRTLELWVELKEAAPLPLFRNQLVSIAVVGDSREPTLTVPLTAVVQEQARSYVFVQGPDGLIERRHVQLGRSDDRYVEILTQKEGSSSLKGVQRDELVVVQGAADVQTTYAAVR